MGSGLVWFLVGIQFSSIKSYSKPNPKSILVLKKSKPKLESKIFRFNRYIQIEMDQVSIELVNVVISNNKVLIL